MALVSGRPISFQMDLYQPLYVPRPVVEPELFASLRPPTYEGDHRALDGNTRNAKMADGCGLKQMPRRRRQWKTPENASRQAAGKPGSGARPEMFDYRLWTNAEDRRWTWPRASTTRRRRVNSAISSSTRSTSR